MLDWPPLGCVPQMNSDVETFSLFQRENCDGSWIAGLFHTDVIESRICILNANQHMAY